MEWRWLYVYICELGRENENNQVRSKQTGRQGTVGMAAESAVWGVYPRDKKHVVEKDEGGTGMIDQLLQQRIEQLEKENKELREANIELERKLAKVDGMMETLKTVLPSIIGR